MHVEQLSQEKLVDAIKLVQNVFYYVSDNSPENALRASLQFEENKELLKERGVRKLAYFLLFDDQGKDVIGVIGQYEMWEDPLDVVWIGWFCIDPAHQGKKLGEFLLRWNMQDAREKGYTTMKLYTSDHPSERNAQGLYDKLGFQITSLESAENNGYTIFYRERQL